VAALVGREAELAVVEEGLAAGETSLAAVAIVGEPGIGKTALWREAVERARGRGATVLLTRPGESEAKLAFAGLTDLLRDVGADDLERLPAPQKAALEVALLRAEASRAPGRRLVGTALLSLLSELSAASPVLVAVDDAQWLDAPTAAALEFALRRLDEQRVCVVVSVRAGSRASFVEALDVRRLELGPLSVAALQRIVADGLGVAFPRPTLVKLAAASKGNAFYALEIAPASGRPRRCRCPTTCARS
jgi:predicted ATPase